MSINTEVLEIARTWIGTPYKHQASLKGVGCDCIGLIVGVWRELYGGTPQDFEMPPYTAFWAEETGRELMVQIGAQYLIPVSLADMIPGDVVMFKMVTHGMTKHAGILSENNKLIHAYSRHDVMETSMIRNAGAKLTHAFRYPDK